MTNLSQWFDLAEQKPWEVGVYEVQTPLYNSQYSYWDGVRFNFISSTRDGAHGYYLIGHRGGDGLSVTNWRGLSFGLSTNPEVKKKQGNKRVPRYVVTIWEEVVATYESKPNAYKHANRHPSGRVKTIRFRTPE